MSSLNAKGRSTAVRLVAETDVRRNGDIMNSASAASSAAAAAAGDIKYSYSAGEI